MVTNTSSAERPQAASGVGEAIPIRLALAEDDYSLRSALPLLLEDFPDIELVGIAADTETAIDLCRRLRPDVALVDVRMPGGGGVRAVEEILRRSPATRVLGFSAFVDRGTVGRMLRAGAAGFVAKGSSMEELVGAIREVGDGNEHLSRETMAALLTEPHPDRRFVSRLDPDGRVEGLLASGAVHSLYQPIVELASGRVDLVEALARFDGRAPRRAPAAWFAEAAADGLLAELELEALRSALRGLDLLPDEVRMSVNLSPETLTSPRLEAELEGVPLDRIVIEVTEHAPIADYEEMRAVLAPLRRAGAGVAVDDAGAGYASLEHIVRLVPDLVKVDITIVRGVDADEARRALIGALVPFAERMGAAVVAEGIETDCQLQTLRELGVTFGQGFFLAPPAPLPERGTWRLRLPVVADGPCARRDEPWANDFSEALDAS